VLHRGHGDGEDKTGEPFLGADGSGTLLVRAGGDGTIASSSTSGLWTGVMVGTCVGRWRRGERPAIGAHSGGREVSAVAGDAFRRGRRRGSDSCGGATFG
jgi:hypothetical protein